MAPRAILEISHEEELLRSKESFFTALNSMIEKDVQETLKKENQDNLLDFSDFDNY